MTEQAAVTVLEYEPGHVGTWEKIVASSASGTMLHTRRFISYHGDRFRDRSLMLQDQRGKIVGVFPAAEDPGDQDLVASHPGLTYGGVVHDGSLRGALMVDTLEQIASHYRDLGYRRLRYKVVPAIYRSAPADDDIYALFRTGAQRVRCDLSAAIDLSRRGKISASRPQRRRRAEAAGVSAKEAWNDIEGFWQILEQNLTRRHNAAPVHSLDEIMMLHDLFPDDILLMAGRIGDELVGGILLFVGGPAMKAQYTATTEEGRALFALDPITEQTIALARERGCRFFDFGTATLDGGRNLIQDLYQFKVSFGAGGAVYEQYETELR